MSQLEIKIHQNNSELHIRPQLSFNYTDVKLGVRDLGFVGVFSPLDCNCYTCMLKLGNHTTRASSCI